MQTGKILKNILLYTVAAAVFFVIIVWKGRTGTQGLIWYGTLSAALTVAGILLIKPQPPRSRGAKKLTAVIFTAAGVVTIAMGMYGLIKTAADVFDGPKTYTVVSSEIVWSDESGPLSLSDGSITFPREGGTVTLTMDSGSMIAIEAAEDDEMVTVSEWMHTGLVNYATCRSHEQNLLKFGVDENDNSSDIVFLIFIAIFAALLCGYRMLENTDERRQVPAAEREKING